MKAELIQTLTSDDLILSGLYLEGDRDKPITILIHGFISDFYSHRFLNTIQEKLSQNNYASCSIQNRGTGIRTEFLEKGRLEGKWIGSFYELLEESHLDISAWIERLKELGYTKFILAGHSLGTHKVVRYLFEGQYKADISKISLLAPFDKNGDIERFTKGKWTQYLETAEEMVLQGKGEDIIPSNFDDSPMSYQSYASWYKTTPLNTIWDFYKGDDYDGSLLKQINIPVQVVVGDKDDFFYIPEYSTIDSTKEILNDNIKDIQINLLKDCNHTYVGFEPEVANLLHKFISEDK